MRLAFPPPMSFEAYELFKADQANWLPIAVDIGAANGLPGTDVRVFSNGINLVVALDGGHVLKIYPPMLRHQFIAERASLRQLKGRLRLPIPEIVLEGERDGWPYLVITRLAGESGDTVW